MSLYRKCVWIVSSLALMLWSLHCSPVDAQVGIGFGVGVGVGVRGRSSVRVGVGRYGRRVVRRPYRTVDPYGRVIVGRRGRWVDTQPYAAPQYASPQPQSGYYQSAAPYQGGAATSQVVDQQPFPTESDLSAMDEGSLLGALDDVSTRLQARLARFDSAASWHRFLQLPPDMFNQEVDGVVTPIVRVAELQKTLANFDKAAAEPQYAKIAQLPSFVATHLALREVLSRYSTEQNGPVQDEDPFADELRQETLPSPNPQPNTTSRERSILMRTTRS